MATDNQTVLTFLKEKLRFYFQIVQEHLVEACRQSLAVSVAQEDTPFLPITSNQHNGTL